MTKEELAALLNGRQYGSEITKNEEVTAKAAGLVVISLADITPIPVCPP